MTKLGRRIVEASGWDNAADSRANAMMPPMPPIDSIAFVLALALAALLGGLVVFLALHRKQSELHAAAARLEAELAGERRRAEERIVALDETREQLRDTF